MSVEIDWEALTSGPDGQALAESIREFIHAKFQEITLPRFIKTVRVHSFEFGAIGPEVELKDICDPLPDFYEDDSGDDEDEDEVKGDSNLQTQKNNKTEAIKAEGQPNTIGKSPGIDTEKRARPPSYIDIRNNGLRSSISATGQLSNPLLGATTPGIPGGTSNLSYFHTPLTAGLSGTQTPLAAVAGRHLSVDHSVGTQNTSSDGRGGHHRGESTVSLSPPCTAESERSGVSCMSPQGSKTGSVARSTFPSTRERKSEDSTQETASQSPPRQLREKQPEDLQIVSRVRYSGDVKLSLTAEILLDYPMSSFVGIPLRLNITGLSFDGVAILAWIRHRAHFCFLSPDDASLFIGENAASEIFDGEDGAREEDRSGRKKYRIGGLLQEIKVESEIGQRVNGKQSLKNVGKVERFVLEQVRRIFEDELVYPSFWTFLV